MCHLCLQESRVNRTTTETVNSINASANSTAHSLGITSPAFQQRHRDTEQTRRGARGLASGPGGNVEDGQEYATDQDNTQARHVTDRI